MDQKVIDWDGSHVPEVLKELPPGRYVVEPVDDVPTLTTKEESGILAALDELDAGEAVPFIDTVREIRERRSNR